MTSGKRRSQSSSFFDGLHEGIGDADGDVEVGDGVFVGLAGDEIFDIRVVDAQDGHVGAAAGAALGDLAEGMVVDAQEADRAGGLSGGGFDQAPPLGRRREKEKPLPPPVCWMRAASRRVWKMPVDVAAHVVGDGQDKAGGQLSERGAGAGEGGGIGEELLAGQQDDKTRGRAASRRRSQASSTLAMW